MKSHPKHCTSGRTSLLILATLCSVQGCAVVPMAPLIYGSKTVGGLDISTNTSANPGASFSLGYKRDDLALVPVAVRREDSRGQELHIVRGQNNRGDKGDDADKGKGKDDSDALSVFGSFEGRGLGTAGQDSTKAEALAANYFSTGIAAQKLANGFGDAEKYRQARNCLRAVENLVAGLADGDKAKYIRLGMETCHDGQ